MYAKTTAPGIQSHNTPMKYPTSPTITAGKPSGLDTAQYDQAEVHVRNYDFSECGIFRL